MELKVCNLPDPKLAFTNRVFVAKETFNDISKGNKKLTDSIINLSVANFVYSVSSIDGVATGEIAMNSLQRKCGPFMLGQAVKCSVFVPSPDILLLGVTITVDVFIKKAGNKLSIDCNALSESFKSQFSGQVFCCKQQVAMDMDGVKLDLMIDFFEHLDVGNKTNGQLQKDTKIDWKKPTGSANITLVNNGTSLERNDSLFRSDFNFEQLGIGGLDEQFKKMFRTAFASRIFPGIVKQLGINHIRGILLYGPPGCGKTLIARQIGKVLNAREPKIINGPEVLDKYVGGSEEKIRALFADAEKEQREQGDASMLHIIIFDEMDAIMKSRGSTRDSTGVSDSIVNQLLSKIDGVDSLNNILIIGMTNRKDMIDEAILRPGRLEIHIEITLPSKDGRMQILNIKTLDMKHNGRIANEVLARLPELAERTENYTGAELEGLVRNAASFALSRNIDVASVKAMDEATLRVEWADFERALSETLPAFGNKDGDEIASHYRNGVCHYGPAFDELWGTLQRLLNQTRLSARTPLMSVLLEGQVSTGKTALVAKLAAESGFPFIRLLTPDAMIGFNESQRCASLLKLFNDAYRSPLSIIVIDDIERIIEFTPVGSRFSNSVLQTLLVLLRKVPPAPCRLLVAATSSVAHLLEDLQLTQAFQVTIHVSQLQQPVEIEKVLREFAHSMPVPAVKKISSAISSKPIGVKQLLLVLEMARSSAADLDGNDVVTPEQFLECLHTVGF
mmetsp:Transcript_3312/g.4575  ORF Transcript_3312/g.4575 Transcript_3312/m.4575 type:complete len:733 (-) Transcript_3312:177-2375(-)